MPQDNGTFTPEEVEAVRAQLQAELQTRDQALAQLTEALQQARDDLKAATGKYRGLLTASNPGIPDELVQGEDIGALDASLEKARTIVEKVKASVAAQNGLTPVPPGAPPRSAPDLDSLSATDKIKYALRGK
jgi:chromosome segregation ATPase